MLDLSQGLNRGKICFAVGVTTLLVLTAFVLDDASAPAASSRDSAERALDSALALFQGRGETATRRTASGTSVSEGDATLALRRLNLALPRLHGSERRTANSLLARPPAGQQNGAEHQLGSGWETPEAGKSPICTKHFCVHWVNSGEDAPNLSDTDGDGVPNYVEKIARSVEFAYHRENAQLGWREPKKDGKRGGNGKVDVYLSEVGGAGLFGYANADPGQSGKRRFAYLVLDNDYAGFQPLSPKHAEQVTVAHEYNHILQFGIDFYEQIWMYESSATFMEEEVFPKVSDWLRYVPAFARSTATPITKVSAGRGLKIYGTASLNHFLARDGMKPAVVRDAWNLSPGARPRHFAPSAYDRSIRKHGRRGFSKEFARFAATTAEWKTSGKFPDHKRLTDVKRSGKLRVGHSKRTKLDHTSYRLFGLKGGRNAATVRVHLKVSRSTRSALAVIARSGSLKGGKIKFRDVKYLPHGGATTVVIKHPGRYARVTVAAINPEARAKGRHTYRGDNTPFRLRASRASASANCRC